MCARIQRQRLQLPSVQTSIWSESANTISSTWARGLRASQTLARDKGRQEYDAPAHTDCQTCQRIRLARIIDRELPFYRRAQSGTYPSNLAVPTKNKFDVR